MLVTAYTRVEWLEFAPFWLNDLQFEACQNKKSHLFNLCEQVESNHETAARSSSLHRLLLYFTETRYANSALAAPSAQVDVITT